ncbi:MAG: 16S rRNA (uracil(1498)-N(3))-methyltransferase [Alphaproteobacteria bacterium]|nr:16S rRNA (uracil(1498)-N(3))-methyltransferase [Alphaproteobacteria bacterium]
MAIHDFNAERLFVDAPLAAGVALSCTDDKAHYILNVLRLKAGDAILVFNGREGEWRARLSDVTKRRCSLVPEEQVRPQDNGPDLVYLFAPLKRSRLDYMVQKAVELGVSRLQPVFTRRTVADRVNLERMRANAIEAAEQCGILRIPEVSEPVALTALIDVWDENRRIIFCDEAAAQTDPVAILSGLEQGPLAVLIGPEGGFAPEEREALNARTFTTAIPLGPRIMRADTAAVAALALVNAVLGDWKALKK